ncbi:MAG: glycoside hydrolase family 3 N-terminal domain-containing protein [Bacteroidales bacterium]
MKRKLRWISLVIPGLFFLISPVNPGFHSHDVSELAAVVDPPFLYVDPGWADSVMQGMTLDDKIAQMIMVQAYSNQDASHVEQILHLVEKEKVGGIIFFGGGPVRQAHMTNQLQGASSVPLLIAMDAEWGLDFRLDSVIKYPRQMMLGAIRDNDLIYRMGKDMGRQLTDLGVHMNFTPVADINNNPDNPVINTRSFGEERDNVSEKVRAIFTGLQSENILVTAKHFPGHGDTDVDSHLDLPVLNFDRERLDSIELYPFATAIKSGLTGIMVGHLHVPALDNRENRPTTLSASAVHELLQEEMGFAGLIVTDAMSMKGVTNHFEPGDAEVEAVLAGNDIILMPSDVNKAIARIKRAVRKGDIREEQIDASCRKILLAKTWVGLNDYHPVNTDQLAARLNARKYLPLQHNLAKNAITLVKCKEGLLPLMHLENIQMATLNLGVSESTPFTSYLDLYHTADHYYYRHPQEYPADTILKRNLLKYNTLIVSLYYTRSFGNNFDIPPEVSEFLNSIDFDGDLIVNLFGYPYALNVLGKLDNADAIMVSYTRDMYNQQFAAQGIFGGTSITGRLPVSAGADYPAGTGIITRGDIRLRYGCPEAVSMNFDSLLVMEEIINNAIFNKAMPGCQLFIARKGEVIWNKSYGYHTYLKRQPVHNDHLYDLASITKIASTIPAIMKLQDEKRFSIDNTLGNYFKELDTTDMGPLKIRDILTHQAGLKAWIPFYTSTLEPLDTAQTLFNIGFNYTYPYKLGPVAYANRNIVYREGVYSKEYSVEYPLQVAENLYLRGDYRDSIYNTIMQTPLENKEYRYSDLGYYYLYKMVENITDTLFYPYSWFNFYAPLGAETLGFLPLNRFDSNRIVPTENDMIFRRQLIRGHVHDPGAAMLGGICGHAGLFSNANDLAKLMQMYLNQGTYGGKKYIDSATLSEFTRCQFCDVENRRALGFDRPITDEEDAGPACNEASEVSYGHTGFTGTMVWMDPKYDLLYIFLSNRVHPDQYNPKLISLNVRTEIQKMIYRSIEEE